MARVKRKHTKPEIAVRKLLTQLGYRYRLHRDDLPGRPDLALIGRKKAIFVHGCFWHRHPGCQYASTPKTRIHFWESKFARNIERDHAAIYALERLGWGCLVLWECETRQDMLMEKILQQFLKGQPNSSIEATANSHKGQAQS